MADEPSFHPAADAPLSPRKRRVLVGVTGVIAGALAVAASLQDEAPTESDLRAEVLAHIDDTVDALAALDLHVDPDAFSVEVKNDDAVADDFRRSFSAMLPADFHDMTGSLLHALGVTDDADGESVRSAAIDSMQAMMLAYYQPDSAQFVVLDAPHKHAQRAMTGLDGLVRHELVHAWQDQQGLFDSMLTLGRASAEQARVVGCLIEGHAELVTLATLLDDDALRALDAADLQAPLAELFAGVYAEIYRAGLAFMLHRYKQGGWDAVRRALDDPPTSTEQILHPEKDGLDLPATVTIPDLGGTVLHEASLGQLQTLFFLRMLDVEIDDAQLASFGWDGDALRVLATDADERLVIWRSLWDRVEDAEQFADVLRAAPGVVSVHGRLVDWIGHEAPDEILVARLAAAVPALPDPDEIATSTTAAAEETWRARMSERSSSDGVRWTHPVAGLAVPIPEGFRLLEMGESSLLTSTSHESASFTANVNVTVATAPDGFTLDAFMEANREQIAQLTGWTIAYQRRVKISERDAVLYEMDADPTFMGTALRFAGVGYLRDGKQVVVTAAAASETWSHYEDTFFDLLLNLEIDDEE